MSEPVNALGLLAPHMIVAFTGAVVLVADLISKPRAPQERDSRGWLAYVGIAGLALAALASILQADSSGTLLWGTVRVDALTVFFDLLFIGIGMTVLLLSVESLPGFSSWPGEFYALVIWCTLGNMLVAPAADLFTLFVCFQLSSIPIIALIGFGKSTIRSKEAGLKYLLMVLISMAVFLYGLSLVYGSLGTSSMAEIGSVLRGRSLPGLAAAGLVLMLAGFGFKTTAAPFQQWVPDVYEGAPTTVTAFLSAGSKLTGFALVLRFVVTGLNAQADLSTAFAALAVASMLIGNLGALQQTNMKRLLAYSGIAQAGYMLVGLAAMSEKGIAALLFYGAAYAIANLCAFAVVIAFADATGSEAISDYAGLSRRAPLAGLALTLALLSLGGLPLLAGFMAKFYVFLYAARAGLLWLVVIGVINSVIALYYYLRIVWQIYVLDGEPTALTVGLRSRVAMSVGIVGIFALGMAPQTMLKAAQNAGSALFGG